MSRVASTATADVERPAAKRTAPTPSARVRRPRSTSGWPATGARACTSAELEEFQQIHVCTRNSLYELVVINHGGDVRVRGGKYFPDWTVARFAGCTAGGSFLKRLAINLGLQMEFEVGRRRIVTSPVRTIADPAENAAGAAEARERGTACFAEAGRGIDATSGAVLDCRCAAPLAGLRPPRHPGPGPTTRRLNRTGRETLRHFQALVRMDTSDPPGNERRPPST